MEGQHQNVSEARVTEPDSDGETETTRLTKPVRPVVHLDDVIGNLKFGKFHWKMTGLACLSYFSACVQMMLMIYLSQPAKEEWDLGTLVYPMLPLFRSICSILASFACGSLGDKFGRQRPLMISLVIVAVFGILTAFPTHFSLLVIAVSMVGIGTSGIEAVNFVLLLEFLPKKNRGSVMVLITFCGALGAVYAAGMAWLMMERLNWRWFVGMCALPAVLTVIYRLYVNYESPRYLFVSGREDEAMDVLKEMVRQNNDALPEAKIICPPHKERGRIPDLFTKELRCHSIFTTLVWFMQSMGFWSQTLYLPEFMATISMDSYFVIFLTFVSELPGLGLAMVMIGPNMLGRIKCLRFFSFFTCVSLLSLAFVKIDYLKAITLMMLYFFMAPIYSILNTYTPEVYPTSVRSIAMGFVYMVISFPSFFMSYLAPTVLSTNIKWLYPVVGSAFFVCQFLFTFGLKTESAGQGLIEQDAGDNQSSMLKQGSNGCVYGNKTNDDLKQSQNLDTRNLNGHVRTGMVPNGSLNGYVRTVTVPNGHCEMGTVPNGHCETNM